MKKNLVLLILLFSVVEFLFSQHLTNHLWTKVGVYQLQDDGDSGVAEKIEVDRYKLDIDGLRRMLERVPVRNITLMGQSKMPDSRVVISFPSASGEMESYRIIETPVFHPDLSARYPDIKSYKGIGIEDPTSVIGFSLSSEKGFSSMVLYGTARSVFIEPHDLSQSTYNLFKKRKRKQFKCLTESGNMARTIKEAFRRPYERFPTDRKLRTYRIAISTNSAYTIYHGGTKGNALVAINTTLTRVNLIYERDLAISLQLIPNNEDIIFTNPKTDPYPHEDHSLLLNNLLQEILTNTIGEANYDVGHLFFGSNSNSNGNSGCIGCVCEDGMKGSGWTIGFPPEGQNFDVDYVTHEIGHQFGARHTFTYSNEVIPVAQLEPGSGSTIMGYAGITDSLTDVQDHSDDYFHFISIEQILDYVFTTKCFTETSLVANFPPTADAGADYTIPHSTAFVLRGSGTDPNARDILTYCWEQADQGKSETTLPNPNNVEGPLFRSRLPALSPNRYMPVLDSVLKGKLTTKWETVSSVSRTLNFSLTVRDNVLHGGQNANDRMVVTVDGNTDPFRITSQEEIPEEIWYGGDKKLITWDTADTRKQPINCQKVNIFCITDESAALTTLSANTPNDGSEVVILPMDISTTRGRIWVEAADNIFYAVNKVDIPIKKHPGFDMLFAEQSQAVCDAKEVIYEFEFLTVGDYSDFVLFSTSDLPPGTTAAFEPAIASKNNTMVKMTISSSSSIVPEQYKIKVYGTGTTTTTRRELIIGLNVYKSNIDTVVLTSPKDGAKNLDAPLQLDWEKIPNNAGEYIIEISTDKDFNNIVEVGSVNKTSYLTQNIVTTDQNIQYYWRVKLKNACREGAYSAPYSFTVGPVICEKNFASDDVGQEINHIRPIVSSLHMPASHFNSIVSDINVTLDITHTWAADLVVTLISPKGTRVLLTSDNGKDGNYTNTTFDDDAATSITVGTAPFTGTFSPEEPLSAFNGELVDGEWKLAISDMVHLDDGILNSWKMDICIVPVYGFLMNALSPSPTVCLPNNKANFKFAYMVMLGSGFSEETTFSTINLPSGVMASFSPQTAMRDTTIQLTLIDIDNLSVGAYPFNVVGTSATLTDTLDLTLTVYGNVFETVALQLPPNGTLVRDDVIVHQWKANENVASYVIEIAEDDENFEEVIKTDTVSTNRYMVNNIGLTGKTYYWRVKPFNDCYEGEFSEPYSYMRLTRKCEIYHSTDIPKDIVNLATSNINSDLDLVKDKDIDITVTLDITHTSDKDLVIGLASPQQNSIILAKNVGFGGDNFTNTTFDDNAQVSVSEGTAPFTGVFSPHESFSNFDGENLKGDWHLLIRDVLSRIDSGVLNSWNMEICYIDDVDVAVLDIYVESEKCDTSKAIVKTRIANNSSYDLSNIPIVLNVFGETEFTMTDTLVFLGASQDTVYTIGALHIRDMNLADMDVTFTVHSAYTYDMMPVNNTIDRVFYISSNQFPPTLPETTTFVFVGDSIRPVVKCKDIRRYISKSENVSILPAEIDDGSTDNCGIDTMSLLLDNFTCEDIGNNEVAMIVVDDFENFDICIANVEILPKRDTIFQSINTNEASVICVDEVTDFCENDYNVGICTFPLRGTAILNENQCVEYIANERFVEGKDEICIVACNPEDVCDTTIVIVEADISRPVAKCKDIRRYITKTETISISPDDINNGSSGVHGIDTMYLDASSFTCENIGDNEVTLMVKDTLGNIESCMATVTILPKKDTIYQTIKVNTTTAVCTDEVTDFCEVVYGIEIIKYPSNGVFSIWFYCGYYTPYKEFTNGVEEIHFVSVNANGVRDTTVVFIEVSRDFDVSTMFIPQLLTPNEDGLNDRWAIPYLKDHSSSYKENRVTVFTGTGRIIYDKKNYGKEGDYWDGYYRGERVSEGIYYYHIMIDGDRKNARTGYIYIRW